MMSRKRVLRYILVTVFLVMGTLGVEWVRREMHHSKLAQSNGRFEQLAYALRLYHSRHGQFPPITYSERADAPTHSWRVLMMPILEMKEAYEKYSFEEAWNGPNNSRLAESLKDAPSYYRSPFSTDAQTEDADYIAVRPKHLHKIQGELRTYRVKWGDSEFILAEVPNSGIHWMSPDDEVALTEALSTNPKF